MPLVIRKVHRCSGLVLAAFVIVHLFNHLLLAVDVPAAFAFMEAFRLVYRHPAVETLLLAAVLAQLASGLVLARRRGTGPASGLAARLSGYYLLFFLLVHVAAVLWGRLGMGVDTDIRFAAAGMPTWPGAAFFIPYYFLAVLAVCVHAGLGISALAAPAAPTGRAAWPAAGALGILLGAAIVGGLLALVWRTPMA